MFSEFPRQGRAVTEHDGTTRQRGRGGRTAS